MGSEDSYRLWALPSDIAPLYSPYEGAFTKFLANVIHLLVLLDLDTCNASAPDNPMVSFPEPGDTADRGNRPVTMMNSILLLTMEVTAIAQPAGTKGLPQENMNC